PRRPSHSCSPMPEESRRQGSPEPGRRKQHRPARLFDDILKNLWATQVWQKEVSALREYAFREIRSWAGYRLDSPVHDSRSTAPKLSNPAFSSAAFHPEVLGLHMRPSSH